MSTIKKVEIPADVSAAVQAADLEQSSRKEILVACIERGLDTESETFKRYQKEYSEWYMKFNQLKDGIQNDYVEPLNTMTESAVSWSLDYVQSTLTITY